MRLAHTQVWPAFLYFEAIAPLTAISMSASSKTMNGALPPNSSDSFLTVLERHARSYPHAPFLSCGIKVELRSPTDEGLGVPSAAISAGRVCPRPP